MSDSATMTNGARRVYTILTNAYNYPVKAGGGQTTTTLAMWGNVLAGPSLMTPEGPASRQYEDEVLPLLMELRREIAAVDATLRNHDDYRGLIAPLIEAASRIAGTAFLNQDWNGMKAQHFKPELASAWGLLSLSLPNTDYLITEEQLAELVAAVKELEEAAQSPDLPDALRVFVRGQVDALRAALRDIGY